MSKRIDKEKELKEMQESQTSLVNALESIHTLLEESETKLSAARESLAGSRIDNQKHYNPKHAKPLSEPETDHGNLDDEDIAVPVLEDIVVPGAEQEPLPLFAETETAIEEAVEISAARKQEFIDRLEAIQIEMDDYLNEMLVRCMAGIELDLKETLSQKLQELRDIIEK